MVRAAKINAKKSMRSSSTATNNSAVAVAAADEFDDEMIPKKEPPPTPSTTDDDAQSLSSLSFGAAIIKTSLSVSSLATAKGLRPNHSRRNECAICGKTFVYINDLRKHLRIHTNERPFGCDQCSRSFRQAGCLKNHIASQHGTNESFTCFYCNKAFPIKERLRLHMRIHSGERPYKCQFCPKTFARGGQVSGKNGTFLLLYFCNCFYLTSYHHPFPCNICIPFDVHAFCFCNLCFVFMYTIYIGDWYLKKKQFI